MGIKMIGSLQKYDWDILKSMERLIFHIDVNSAFLSWESARRVSQGLPEKMWPLPVRNLLFLGKASEQKLLNQGIRTIGDLAREREANVQLWLGEKPEHRWKMKTDRKNKSAEMILFLCAFIADCYTYFRNSSSWIREVWMAFWIAWAMTSAARVPAILISTETSPMLAA